MSCPAQTIANKGNAHGRKHDGNGGWYKQYISGFAMDVPNLSMASSLSAMQQPRHQADIILLSRQQ